MLLAFHCLAYEIGNGCSEKGDAAYSKIKLPLWRHGYLLCRTALKRMYMAAIIPKTVRPIVNPRESLPRQSSSSIPPHTHTMTTTTIWMAMDEYRP